MGKKEALLERIQEGIVYLDGGMGSLLQKRALDAGLSGIGTVPEILGITHPQLIRGIHEDYVKEGADIILSATFGANRYKLGEKSAYTQEEIVRAALKNAKDSGAPFVAMDIGPIGALVGGPTGISEEQAYEMFRELAVLGEENGADLIVIETMTDLQEARLALLAAKEHTNLPVLVSMTFEKNGRTLTGSPPEVCALVLDKLGADMIGTNCSTGPKDMLENVKRMRMGTDKPLAVQPNAGIPSLVEGKTVYDIDAHTFSQYMREIALSGARILGGCCGTEPEHIRKTIEKTKDVQMEKRSMAKDGIASPFEMLIPGERILRIGESINPSANQELKVSLKEGSVATVVKLGQRQQESGADLLDVNVGLAGADEAYLMEQSVRALSATCVLPLQIDTTKPLALERALRAYPGRAIVNSVNGTQESMDAIFPLIAKYGAKVVGLTLDESGIPKTAEEKIRIAKKLIEEAARYGIPKEDLIIDCLCLTVSTQQEAAGETLKAIRRVREELGLHTTLGVSNISFGLPNRSQINAFYLTAAMTSGLDMPILSVFDPYVRQAVDTFELFNGTDVGCASYTRRYKDVSETKPSMKTSETEEPERIETEPVGSLERIAKAVFDGQAEETQSLVESCLLQFEPMDIIKMGLIPGLDLVGEAFETGEAFLPNLLFSAEAAQRGFEKIKEAMGNEESVSNGTILLATVEGDVHDIGKNILKVILENYGFHIIDLGKDVPVDQVAKAVKEQDCVLLGLSALMTTSIDAMEETIKKVREISPRTKIMVGGAVLSEAFSKEIGADYYGKDAKAGADIARIVFKK